MPRWVSRGALCLAAIVLSAAPVRADTADEVRAALAEGRAADALQRAESAQAASASRDPTLRFLQGVALMDLGRDAQALAVFSQLAELYPELADPWNNAAVLHWRAGDIAAAQRALEAALRADPRHRPARANLAQLQLLLAVRGWESLAAEGALDAPAQARLRAALGLLEPARR